MKRNVLSISGVVCGIMLVGALCVHAQIPSRVPVKKPLPTTPTIRPPVALASVVTFTPQTVRLEGGGDPISVKVSSTIKVSNVKLQVLKDGRPVSGVRATTGRDWPASGTISLRADGSAIVADGYQLKVAGTLDNQQAIEAVIPKSKLSISVDLMGVKLTRIVPSSGERGSTARVEGSGFLSLSPLTVEFTGASVTEVQNQSAPILEKTNTSITLKIPPHAESGKIKLILGVGGTFISAVSDFRFTVIQRPTIESFTPTGGAPGTTVEVRGYNLTTWKYAGPVFKFSNDVTAFCSQAGIQVEATDRGSLQKAIVAVPNGAVTGPLKVLTPLGTGTSAQSFQVITELTASPVITQFAPASGNVGTVITISGNYFGQDVNGVGVKFGLQQTGVNPSSCTNQSIRVTVPASATTGKITVTTSGGTAKSTGTFFLPPSITSLSPGSGPEGYRINIMGANFDIVTISNNIVKFNGTPATVISAGMQSPGPGTRLTVEVPARAVSGPITVETPGGKATSSQSFTIVQ